MLTASKIHSEVIVDQVAGLSYYRDYYSSIFRFGGDFLAAPTNANEGETIDRIKVSNSAGISFVSDIADDAVLDIDRRTEFLSSPQGMDLTSYHNINSDAISQLQTILLPGRVFGYVMRNRRWFALSVALLQRVADLPLDQMLFRTRYEDLVLPRGHKKLLQALVSHYTMDRTSDSSSRSGSQVAMDVVHGKGEGLIILLHGPPGVGKTSTAECVAAQLQRPLLPITCGDLGDFKSEIERKLDDFCRLAYKWRCVLLLDEADVFLAKREKGHSNHNATVGGTFLGVDLRCCALLTVSSVSSSSRVLSRCLDIDIKPSRRD